AGYGVEGEAKIFQSIPLVFCFDGRLFNICQFYADILPFNDESLLHYNHDFKGDTVDKQIHVEETGIVPECTRANSVYKGIIKNTEDKTPVAMAKIELLHEGVLIETIYSDTNGNFKGTKKKPGSYTLRVSAPYYNKWESQITIETGKETMLEIALKPQAVPKSTWTATVINAESSELIENAKLEITTLNNISLAEIYTDINGYASGLLPVGTYTVRISHPKYKARTETIEIEENKAAEFSWELTPASEETGGLMYGYLVCPNINGYNPETGVGRIPFGTIEFYDAYSQLISSVTADENGYYECDVPENCYSYKAYGEKCLKSESSDTPLFTTGGTYDFELKPKDFTSSLWLITSDKQTIRSAFVKITAVESDFYTKSESVYSKNYYFLDPFVFYLPIGTYQISVTDAYYAKENQIEYKAKDKEEIFTIQDNDGIFELKVTLEPTGNSYSVNNELNLSDETVLARPASPSNAVRVASPSNAAHSYDTDITLEDTDAKYKED
ncbi:carboxypeptidase regulatory-like domain-containing protein, partial [Dysgonomonas gadei]|uniref:carboxypeptidase regulatory-like domain-containing protein n=1 Tax=Dysgonomonas gadei TaxID=156974 RepID=UPI003AF186B5